MRFYGFMFIWLCGIILNFGLSVCSAQTQQEEIPEPIEGVQQWEDRVIAELDEMARKADDNHYFTSICVYDLTYDALLYGYNHQKKMRPASTQKLITAISALDQLGPDYQFATKMYYTGNVSIDAKGQGTLVGDIYIVGGMDPMFGKEGLNALADSLKTHRINRLVGNVYADVSMKDTMMLGKGWCWDDDNPRLTPLTLSLSAIKSQISNLKSQISITYKTYPGGGTLVGTTSHTLKQVLQRMLKQSDNGYAESVLYQLGAQKKKNCTFADCVTQIKKTLSKTDQPLSSIEIADGSGLSLYNYITPRMEVALLKYANQVPEIFNTLYPSLPIAGIDGTLSSRLKGTKAQGNVHAKTGTVSHVITLAGYLTAPTGHLFAFSIMSNGTDDKSETRSFHDRILKILTE